MAIVLDVEFRVREVLDVALRVVVATIAIDIHPVTFDLDADERGWSKEGVQDRGIPKVTRSDILYGTTGWTGQSECRPPLIEQVQVVVLSQGRHLVRALLEPYAKSALK